jgi:hypothetical protein
VSPAAAAQEPEVRWAKRPPRRGRRLLAWAAVLGLAALALALLSDRNARGFTLALDGGALVVRRGLFLPAGTRSFAPADPALARAYAPVPAPPGWAPPQGRLDGAAELDQALFGILSGWAGEDLASGSRERIARALGYVERAGLLPGIAGAQRDALELLRAEAGFHEGRGAIGRSAAELRRARDGLARTARSASAHAGEAGEALRELEQALEALHRAGRALGAGPDAGATPAAPPGPPAAAGAADR